MGVFWQLAAEGNRFHHSERLKRLAVVVVSVQDCHHTEVVGHHSDTAQQGQGQIVYHTQKNSRNRVCSMAVHTSGMVSRRTVEEEEDRWVTEMAAGGHWEDKSEEDKVVLQHGAPVEVVVEVDSWMDVTAAAVEVDEVLVEGIGDVGSVDIAGAAVLQAENVAAGITPVGIADWVFPAETEQVVGNMDLSEKQLGFGLERIGLEVELEVEVANPVVEEVEEEH